MTQTTTTKPLTADLAMTNEVRTAAKAFAATLADTPEFRAFEESHHAFKHSRAAQDAVHLFEQKQRALQMMQQLGVVEPTERDELNRLRETMMNEPNVHAYVEAQDELMVLCQTLVKEMSRAIGIDFAGACAPSCCG